MSSNWKAASHTMRTTLGGAALLLTIAMTATGCSGSTPHPASPQTSPSQSPTSPSTPPAATPQEKAHTAARAAMRHYVAVTTAVSKRPTFYKQLARVASGSALLSQQNDARYLASKGWHLDGDGVRIAKMEVAGDALREKPPYVQLNVCTSFSGQLVDKAGEPVDVGKRQEFLTSLYSVANYGKAGWRVSVQKDNDAGSSSCEL